MILLFVSFNFGKDLKPAFTLKASGAVVDMMSKNNLLYVATVNGIIDIFDIKTKN